MTLQPFVPTDLLRIELQPAQQNFPVETATDYGATLLDGLAYTLHHDGVLMACFGSLNTDEADMGHVWAFLSRHVASRMVRITRVAARFFSVTGKAYLRATCEVDYDLGQSWLHLLGFEIVDTLPGYGWDDRDHYLFYRSNLACRF